MNSFENFPFQGFLDSIHSDSITLPTQDCDLIKSAILEYGMEIRVDYTFLNSNVVPHWIPLIPLISEEKIGEQMRDVRVSGMNRTFGFGISPGYGWGGNGFGRGRR